MPAAGRSSNVGKGKKAPPRKPAGLKKAGGTVKATPTPAPAASRGTTRVVAKPKPKAKAPVKAPTKQLVKLKPKAGPPTPPTKRQPKGKLIDAGGKVNAPKNVGHRGFATVVNPLASVGLKVADKVGAPKSVKDVLKFSRDVASNAPRDAFEMAVTWPSSTYHMIETAHKNPEKLPAEMIAPYKELAKDPVKFAREKPVSAGLMVQPVVRVPGRVAGKAARKAGVQKSERPPATVPGTPLKETRVGSKGLVTRAVQARRDRKKGSPKMTKWQVRRRVDEFYDADKHHRIAAVTQAKKDAKNLPEDEREAFVQAAADKARVEGKRRFAEEFGAVARPAVGGADREAAAVAREAAKGDAKGAKGKVRKARKAEKEALLEARVARARDGRGVPPKQADALIAAISDKEQATTGAKAARDAAEQAKAAHKAVKRQAAHAPLVDPSAKGRVFEHEYDARKVADRNPFGAEDPANPKDPFMPVIVQVADDGYAVVPNAAAKQLTRHKKVGTAKAEGAVILRVTARQYKNTVLPTSTKWLAGQAAEPQVRNRVAGAVPVLDRKLYRKVLRELEAVDPEAAASLRARVTGGGGMYSQGFLDAPKEILKDHHTSARRTLADEFDETVFEGPANAATRAGQKKAARVVRAGWRAHTSVMFAAAGKLDQIARESNAGRQLRHGPLMDGRVITWGDKAIDDAVNGLRSTENQVQLARSVDRSLGKYSKMSPALREQVVHNLPFIPWAINVVKFLGYVLPKDHPVMAALLANVSAAAEEWRKEYGLSMLEPKDERKPGFLQGRAPAGEDRTRPLGQMLPSLPGSPGEALASLAMPQYSALSDALQGEDFTGKKIEGTKAHLGNFLGGVASSQVPFAGPALRVTGLDKKMKGQEPTGTTEERLKQFVNPVAATSKRKPKVRKKKSAGPPAWNSGGGGGSSSGSSGPPMWSD